MELIVRYKFYDFVSIIEYETVFNDFETEDSFYIKLFEMFNQISKHIRKHELFPYYKTYTNGVIFDNQNNVKENGHETLKKGRTDRTAEETDSVSTFASPVYDYDRNLFLCTVVWMELCICRIYTWCFNF